MHTLECCRSLDVLSSTCIASLLFVSEYEWTDSCVWADERTLVTLDTVLYIPNRNECLYATLLISSGTVLPCAIYGVVLYEVRNLEQVTSLCVDRTNEFLNECRCFILLNWIVSEVSPCWIYSQLFVFTTTVNSSIVLVTNV